MARTQGLNITFAQCNDAAQAQSWSDWYDDIHLPDIMSTGAFWKATRWEVLNTHPGAFPNSGFTHLNIGEIEGPDIEANLGKVIAMAPDFRAQGRVHPNHVVVDMMAMQAIGRWSEKPAPSEETRGLFMVFSKCNVPENLEAWNEWFDAVHVPDMMETGGFHAATRWERLVPDTHRPNHLIIYEIQIDDLEQSVRNILERIPDLKARGRIRPDHSGALRFIAKPAGKYGASGYPR
jgi:hypothetical protein